MLALGLLLQVLHLDQGQQFFLQASSSCLQAAVGTPSQNLQDLQPIGFPFGGFTPWLHVGFPFGQGSQRKLWLVLQSIP